MFDDPGIVPIRNAVGTGRFEVYIDAVCEAELARVLARGFAHRKLDAAAQEACIAQCRRLAKRIDAPPPEAERAQLPRCADPDDQKFLHLAHACGARWLLSRDDALLVLARRTRRDGLFEILTPDVWTL